MNRSRWIQTIAIVGFVAYVNRAIGQAGDDRNIRALARHLGCSTDDARRLYFLARRDGYGSAFAQMFPSGHIPQRDGTATSPDVEIPARRSRGDRPVKN